MRFLFLLVNFAICASSSYAQESMTLSAIPGGTRPVYAIQAPSDSNRMFVVGQGFGNGDARIRIFDMASDSYNKTPFLELTNEVVCCTEAGLLCMTFHPNYESNGLFYITLVSEPKPEQFQFELREYSRQTPDLADLSSKRTLLSIEKSSQQHNGGWLGFGPDGFLYVTTGDDKVADNAQDINDNLKGKILRINPQGSNSSNGQYGIPASNPFVGKSGDDEIWAYGLRNPWRGSFDRDTGDFYFGDVGGSDIEEVNVQPANSKGGENYGWKIREGTLGDPLPGAIDPVYQYEHGFAANQGMCVIGGYVYRGPIPSLKGHYFFADNRRERIWSFKWDGSNPTSNDATNINQFINWTGTIQTSAGVIPRMSSFAEDNLGNLYIVSHSGNMVFKIEDAVVSTNTASSIALALGEQVDGKISDSFESDDQRIVYSPKSPLQNPKANVRILCETNVETQNPNYLELIVEAHATTVGLDTRIDLFNWSTGEYDRVDQFNTQTADQSRKVSITKAVSDYVRTSDNFVRARIDWRIDDLVLFFPWEIKLDQVIWNTD